MRTAEVDDCIVALTTVTCLVCPVIGRPPCDGR